METELPTLALLSDADRVRAERICSRFADDLLTGCSSSIADNLTGWGGTDRSALFRELLLIELHSKCRAGQIPDRNDYLSVFSGCETVVSSVFDLLDTKDPMTTLESESAIMPSATLSEEEVGRLQRVEEDGTAKTSGSVVTLVDPRAETVKDQSNVETQAQNHSFSDMATLDQEMSSSASVPTGPSHIPPNYEVLGILGQGGMGLVYKARQKRADRIVALKVIRPEKLSGMSSRSRDRAIERFRTEAQAAGRLQHDNIVTVYEVGESNGSHYFSMQFVDGKSLSEIIQKDPLEGHQAAQYIEPVCRAVQWAHEQGILHRDIKPQNILIEAESRRPRIADFGLAKIIDADMEMTRAGESMGTPPYMPPEQFGDAAKVTAKADVYALGATLYHVVSGRPPFKSATAISTMRQVLERDPVPLHELNSAVDKDLETICMKCLEKEPSRRYATAAELADELKRYLNGEPILARPVGFAERGWRWSRRNPVISMMSALIISVILFSVVSLAVANVRTEKAQRLSEASFQDALEAVNVLFTRVSEDRLLNEPGFQTLRRDLLKLARDYYGRLIKRRSDDPTLDAEVADSHFRLGLIVEELESATAAQASYEKALELQRELCRKQPDSKERSQALSKTINALGRLATRSGDLEKADRYFKEVVSLRQTLVQTTTGANERVEYERLLANGWMNIGLLRRRQAEIDEARNLMNAGQDQRKKSLSVRPADRPLRRDLAKGWYNLANLEVDAGDAQAVSEQVELAIRDFEILLEEDPEDLRDRYMLSLCYRLLVDLHAALAETDVTFIDKAVKNYSRALEAARRLTARNPAVPSYRAEVAQILLNLGQLEAQRQQFAESFKLLEEAQRLFRTLAEELPERSDYADSEDLCGQMLEKLRSLK
jgi:serine/threonine protein kinase/tetratricopeptide (TPR) repeat protein